MMPDTPAKPNKCKKCGVETTNFEECDGCISHFDRRFFRDQMAAAALEKLADWESGKVAQHDGGFEKRDILVARRCYEIADAMLAEREKGGEREQEGK